MTTKTKIMTVGTLIEALRDLDPDTPVYASGIHARGVHSVTVTTLGDPSKSRRSGDPDGPPCVVIE